MQVSISNVRIVKQPPITTGMTSNLQRAMDEVDGSWTRQRIERLQRWCLSKKAGCEKASMCAGALEKHLDATELLQSNDFLKIAFIVNNGLLLDEDSEGDNSLPEVCTAIPVVASSDNPTLGGCVVADVVESNAIKSTANTSELTMSEIEQQMQELLADD
jgi:hypothetical protein